MAELTLEQKLRALARFHVNGLGIPHQTGRLGSDELGVACHQAADLVEENQKLKEELANKEAKVAELLHDLELMEWRPGEDFTLHCPYCEKEKRHGHQEGCIFAKHLNRPTRCSCCDGEHSRKDCNLAKVLDEAAEIRKVPLRLPE